MFARLTLVLTSVATCSLVVIAQEASTGNGPGDSRPPLFDVGEIEVPSGDTVDIVEFLDEMTRLREDVARDYRNAMTKITAAQAKASNALLDDPNVSDEHFAMAARLGLTTRIRSVVGAPVE
jgi:hypothetical protein